MPPRVLAMIVPMVVAGLLALVGCSGSSAAPLPPAGELLAKSAEAMRGVRSASIAIDVDPATTVVPLRNAAGRVTAAGQADGTAVLALFGGPPVEYTFVVTGGSLYLKGATGGFTTLPLSVVSGIFDPTAVLDPNRGAAALLGMADAPATQAREPVDGVDAYRVAATFNPEQVRTLVPGLTAPVPGVVWLDATTSRLLKAELQLPDQSGNRGGPVTVRLTGYDAPVTIAPPR